MNTKPQFPGIAGELPARLSSPVSFSIKDGVLSARTDTNGGPDASLTVAVTILRREIQGLKQSLSNSNTDPRIYKAVKNFEASIADNINEINVIKFGIESDIIASMYEHNRVEMSNVDAGTLHAIVTIARRIVISSRKWRIFQLEAEAIDVSEIDALFCRHAIKDISHRVAELADHVASDVNVALEASGTLIENSDIGNNKPVLYAIRIVESLVITLVSNFIVYRKISTVSSAESEKVNAHWISEAALMLIKDPVTSLAEKFKDIIGWIPRILAKYLK